MRWGNTQGTHHFVFGARTASPTFCSVRDEPALGPRPSREGSAGRVGALARTRPESCEAALPQRSQLYFYLALTDIQQEMADLSAQGMPPDRRTQ